MTCSTPNCKRPGKAKDLCGACYNRSRYPFDKERQRRYRQDYLNRNRSAANASARKYREENHESEIERGKKYREQNKEVLRANSIMRKKRVKKATPKWADKKAIIEFYKNRPTGCHVDHIVPINGKGVCGLHVLDNLQYLPATENLKKGNKY